MYKENFMEELVALCKRRGFVFQGSEIYGGLGGMYDYGPLGVLLKNNIKESWLDTFVHSRKDMYLVDAAILMNGRVWEATGHVDSFVDPMVECLECKKRSRVDNIVDEANFRFFVKNYKNETTEDYGWFINLSDAEKDIEIKKGELFIGKIAQHFLNLSGQVRCSGCNKTNWAEPKIFNMMLQTRVGASEDSSAISYLRPETAQGIFVNYKNVMDSMSPKLPFGIAQVGKAFRNEITPRDFIFRLRELEQMEIEYFIKPPQYASTGSATGHSWQDLFEYWKEKQFDWLVSLGINPSHLHEYEHPEEGRAFYSLKTVDWEFDFPFGQKELLGLAYRTDYDLTKHQEFSKQKLTYFDQEAKDPETGKEGVHYVPHVLEPTVGLDRSVLAVLSSCYREEILENGETRSWFAFPYAIAPYKVCVSPLLKNKPELVEKAEHIFSHLKAELKYVVWDDNSNIGKRYRRQDEIGTPYCVVVDFETIGGGEEKTAPELVDTVTVRNRDTGMQERVKISDLVSYITK